MNRATGPRRVYFIRPIGMTGPIKIGCSVAPDRRRESLETWAPFPLEVVAEIVGGFQLERRFHTLFADSFIKHEWFKWSPELQQVMDAIGVDEFDLETLPEPASLTAFRKPRANSYSTPEWRYQASVRTRFRTRLNSWPYWSKELMAIVGDGDWLPHRDAIEALIERLTADREAA